MVLLLECLAYVDNHSILAHLYLKEKLKEAVKKEASKNLTFTVWAALKAPQAEKAK